MISGVDYMRLFKTIKEKLRELWVKNEANELPITTTLADKEEMKKSNKILQEKIKHEKETGKFEKEVKVIKEKTEIEHKSKRNIYKKSDNPRIDTYSTVSLKESCSYNTPSLNKLVKNLDKDLNLFERIEVNYFEEIERYEVELEGIVNFSIATREEIGLEGERDVHLELLSLDEDEYKIIHNIFIESFSGKTTEIDTIIISIYGIFVIETKNYRASIFGEEDSEYWYYFYDNKKYNREKNTLYNPIKQNKSHIHSLKLLLGSYGIILPFYSIIVFNDRARLNIKTSTPVIKIKDLVKVIKGYKVKALSNNLIKQIYNEIYEKNKGKKVVKEHSNYVKKVSSKKSAIMNTQMRLEVFVTLYLVPGIGKWTIKFILDNLVYETTSIDGIIKSLSIVKKVNPNIKIPSNEEIRFYYNKALKLISFNKKQGIALSPFYSSDYPEILNKTLEHSLMIYSIGDISCLDEINKVGIIVSSKSTDFAKRSARKFGEICAENNIVVVGIAGKGDNISAIIGALSKKGKVILLVPDQLKVEGVYSKLYHEVASNDGCVISFIKHENSKSNYYRNQYNHLFVRIIDKLIAVDAQHKSDFLKVVQLGVANKKRIAYLVQSNKVDQAKLYKEIELMNSVDAFPLKDKCGLRKFLHIN
jgi:predicted Rossmann fold nucleotide-binding protein DprA/Smf involved in DNA uptake